MGAFYGSIHIRTEDRDSVIAAAERLAKKQQARFLVGPPLRGWVALYPSMNGQDENISRSLARQIGLDILHLLVHDDDLFCYFYYRDGKRVDQYNSRPDYFAPVSAKEKKKLQGRPELLADLLAGEGDVDNLKELLAPENTEPVVFATELLQRFAELLDLPNAVSAYEYLQQDETDGIDGWDEFVHVPDLSGEKAQKQTALADQASAMQRLREQGILLHEESQGGNPFQLVQPFFCAPLTLPSFLVCWANGQSQTPVPLLHYRPAWSEPQPTGIELAPTVYAMTASPSGRYVGVGHASGNWKAEVWDLAGRTRLLEVKHERVVSWTGFTPDETRFVSLGSDDSFITTLATSEQVVIAVPQAKLGAVHSCGTLVVADELGKLIFVDLAQAAVGKALAFGNKQQLEAMRQYQAAQLKQSYASFDAEAFEKALALQLKQVDFLVQQLEAQWIKAGRAAEAAEQVRQYREQLLQGIEKSREAFARQRHEAETGEVPLRSAEGIMCMALSGDGRWLAVGTNLGLRVFAWDDLLAASDVVPATAYRVDAASVHIADDQGTQITSGFVYGVAWDGPGRLVFGGISGRIECLDLSTGQTRTLQEVPGQPPLLRLGLSSDRSALACYAQPDMFSQSRNRRPPALHIWDWSALTREREGPGLRLFNPE